MDLSLAGFELYLSRNRKPRTVRLYMTIMRRLSAIEPLDKKGIEAYFLKLKQLGRSNRYLNIIIQILIAYSKYSGLDLVFPDFKEEPHMKTTMNDAEIEAFLALPCPQAQFERGTSVLSKSWRFWGIMRLFWAICAFTGMRPGEVSHLTVDSVDMGQGLFILEDTKTNTPRMVPIPPNILDDLVRHLNVCDGYLFPSRRGGNTDGLGAVIDSTDWGYDFHKRLKMLGIKRKNLSPYSLRHSFITRLLEEDVNIFKVQKIVGHRRLDTTAHYTHMTQKDIKEAVKKHPLIRQSTSPTDILSALRETIKGFHLELDSRFIYAISESSDGLTIDVRLGK